MRGAVDPPEYKHAVLGLIFLKYISNAFAEKDEQLANESGADAEDGEYLAENVFWVPPEARWPSLQAKAKMPEIGRTLDDAMTAIERDNRRLKGVLVKDYARTQAQARRTHRPHRYHRPRRQGEMLGGHPRVRVLPWSWRTVSRSAIAAA